MTEEITQETEKVRPSPPPETEDSTGNSKGAPHWLTPLPWEEGKGFLWGFPKTVWLLLRHPFQSFERPDRSSLPRSLRFLCSMWFLVGAWTLLTIPIFTRLFSGDDSPENVSSFWETYLGGLTTALSIDIFILVLERLGWAVMVTLPIYGVLRFHAKLPRTFRKAFRISIYCAAADILLIFPVFGKTINLLMQIAICGGGLRASIKRRSTAKAIALGIFCYVVQYALFWVYVLPSGSTHLIQNIFRNWFWPL